MTAGGSSALDRSDGALLVSVCVLVCFQFCVPLLPRLRAITLGLKPGEICAASEAGVVGLAWSLVGAALIEAELGTDMVNVGFLWGGLVGAAAWGVALQLAPHDAGRRVRIGSAGALVVLLATALVSVAVPGAPTMAVALLAILALAAVALRAYVRPGVSSRTMVPATASIPVDLDAELLQAIWADAPEGDVSGWLSDAAERKLCPREPALATTRPRPAGYGSRPWGRADSPTRRC